MAKTIDTKTKLNLLTKPGIGKLILDVVSEVNSDCNEGNEGVGMIALARYSERILGRLRTKYALELKSEKVVSQTMDLEVLIENIKTGKEPEWKNKHNTK